MTKYEIKVSQLLAGTITVTAKNAENAMKKAKKSLKNGEITLDSAEDVKFEIVSEVEKTSKKTAKKETAKEVKDTPVSIEELEAETAPAPVICEDDEDQREYSLFEEQVKEEPKKLTVADYEAIIRQKKNDAHNIDWLYIEIDANLLLNEVEPGVDNIDTVAIALAKEMLEGDYVVCDAVLEDGKMVKGQTVRYYCDNLAPSRRKLSDLG